MKTSAKQHRHTNVMYKTEHSERKEVSEYFATCVFSIVFVTDYSLKLIAYFMSLLKKKSLKKSIKHTMLVKLLDLI